MESQLRSGAKKNVIQSRAAAWNLANYGSLTSYSSAGIIRYHTAIGKIPRAHGAL